MNAVIQKNAEGRDTLDKYAHLIRQRTQFHLE